MIEVAEIRARAEKATEGPWQNATSYSSTMGWPVCGVRGRIICDMAIVPPVVRDSEVFAETLANAAFIAHASTDIPALLSEVERLQAEINKWVKSWSDKRDEADCEHQENERLQAENAAMKSVLSECRRHVSENLIRMYGHDGFGEIRRIDAALASQNDRAEK